MKIKLSEAIKPQLIDIQKLQFSNKPAAEAAMLEFLRDHEDATIQKVELNPKPESLNSICGFVTFSPSERYFFKTHVEESEQVCEYYNAESLARAGYPVITAKQITHRVGKQIVLYEIVSFPTLFDLIKSHEDDLLLGRTVDQKQPEALSSLMRAQNDLDRRVFDIYKASLSQLSKAEHALAPIHQLFRHRLASDGRLGLFYEGKQLEPGPHGNAVAFEELAQSRWIINGVEYNETLATVVERSRSLLEPQPGPSVVGHGDAHNGNVFVDTADNRFLLFDPAFAGRHDPLLDLTKPLFHNVFARWMYHPEQVQGEFSWQCTRSSSEIRIDHSFMPSDIRREIMRSKIALVLHPLVLKLREEGMLRADWKDYLRSALFCCPFLTVNLFSRYVSNGTLAERYQFPIKLLGLCMSMELGSAAREGSSLMTLMIDEIFAGV